MKKDGFGNYHKTRRNAAHGTIDFGGNFMETITLDRTPTTDADYEAIVDHNLSRLKQIQQKMDEDQQEIEAMRAETDVILAELMQSLKTA